MSTVLLAEIYTRMQEAGLCGGSALVWVSGGVDSVTLLALLAKVREEGGLGRLEVVHVDHNLRPDSGADARFVEGLAVANALPFHLVSLGEGDFPAGLSTQEAAREARFRECEAIRVERGLDFSALAHHADDQAETVLFRLLRGAGPRGAAGMRFWSPPLFRPLLGTSKAALQAFAAEAGLAHREDATNATPKYSRNRVRNELLPLAAQIAPGASSNLVRFARLAAEDDDYMTRRALEVFEELAEPQPEGYRFPVRPLLDHPPALARRVVLAAARRLGSSASHFDSSHLDAVLGLLLPGRGGRKAPLPGPLLFARCGRFLWVADPARLADPVTISRSNLLWGISKGMRPPADALSCAIPLGRPDGEIVFRPRLEGDRLGGVKVKDLLMEAGIPRWRRELALVAEDSVGTLALFAPGRVFGNATAKGATLWLDSEWWLNPASGPWVAP